MMLKTLRLRVKDKHAGMLHRMACQVNTTWNYVNELSARAIRERGQFMSGYDLQKYTAGYTKCEGVIIRSGTVERVCDVYASRRKQFTRARLSWRVSNPHSARHSLGWIPFKARECRYRSGQIHYAGHAFSLWDSYGLAGRKLRSGSFSQDARGRWYINVAVEVEPEPSSGATAIGIDLGLRAAATTSDGRKLVGRDVA